MGTRAVGYVRISLDATGEGRGVARQQEDVEELIGRRSDWSLICDVFSENDLSASGRKKRPKFDQMVAMIEAGEVDAVVAWSWDRLSRNRRDELRLIEAAQSHGVTIALVRGSDIDMSTPAGRMVADMLATQARYEIDQKGDRQMRANKQRADNGEPSIGGRRAFGYEPDHLTVRESEAVHVRRAFTSLLAGASLKSMARELNQAGVATGLGNRLTHISMRHMLTNPRYAGIRVHRGVEVGPATWAAIIDEPTFRAAQSILIDPSRRTNNSGGERRRLLTGVALCGVCNDGRTTVLGGSRGVDKPLYQCGGERTKHLQRLSDPVDYFVETVVLERLSRPDAAELLIDANAPDLDALNAERLELVGRQEALALDFSRPGPGAPTPAMMRTANTAIEHRIAEIDALMRHRNREHVLGDLVRAVDPAATWQTMSLERRQAVLRAFGTWTINRGKVGGNPRSVRYPTLASHRVDWDPAPGITA